MTLYLYAIVGARPRGALGAGIGGRRLSVVRAGPAHVVVERDVVAEPSARALRAHDRVVRRVAKLAPAVLPFRFGATAADAKALSDLLTPAAAAVTRALERVRGCVQITLRVVGEPAPSAPSRRAAGPGARWLEARLAARRVPEIAEVTAATKPWVRAARVERHDKPPLVASVYHLVARADLARYRAALRRASRELAGVEVKTSGPFPPYAFAELSE